MTIITAEPTTLAERSGRTDEQSRTGEGNRRAEAPPTVRGDHTWAARRATLGARYRRRCGAVVAQGKDAGMATAEYAIAMIAAVGFAGLLVTLLTSSTVRNLLTGLVTSALTVG